MALNLNIIDEEIVSKPFQYDQDDVMLYSLGIGAGLQDINYIYEKNLKVFPTFVVIPFIYSIYPLVGKANINILALLHGEQRIDLFRPIPVTAKITCVGRCTSIYDKGDKGAVINVESEGKLETGEVLFKNNAVLIDRSAGNFGGERGPKAVINPLPDHKKPDFSFSQQTMENQAALYRLSGDKNPLHIDPDFAAQAGFNRPILHGLCTYGFAGRAVLQMLCQNDANLLKSLSMRFMDVVYPGDTLTTEGWQINDSEYAIQTKTQNGNIVLGNGVARIKN